MKLSDREWKDFSVPYIFQKIQRGKRLKNADHVSGILLMFHQQQIIIGLMIILKQLMEQEYLKTALV